MNAAIDDMSRNLHVDDVIRCESCGKPGTSFCVACRLACTCSGCRALQFENHDTGDEDRS